MKRFLILTAATIAALATVTTYAGNAEAGKAKSATCAACHGPTGVSGNPLWPNLAGQKEAYLAKQIKAYKDGVRQDATMAPMVAALTDEDIADLAAYFASQSCK